MKASFTFVALLLIGSLSAISQGIPPAPEGKSVVYFVRLGITGQAINFSYFDSTKLIGRWNGRSYQRYECAPGKHLFWARSENREYVEADLEAGKIYFIDAITRPGAFKAGVVLNPCNTANAERVNKLVKYISTHEGKTFTDAKLAHDETDLKDAVVRGMAKYKEEKAAGQKQGSLPGDWYYKP